MRTRKERKIGRNSGKTRFPKGTKREREREKTEKTIKNTHQKRRKKRKN